jgi:hypothetical protein
MHRSFSFGFLILIALFAVQAPASAQTKKPADELRLIQRDAALAIDSINRMDSARLAGFNTQLAIVGEMKPLEPQSLDSAKIVRNIARIEELVGWLTRFQDTSKRVGGELHAIIQKLRAGSEEAGRDKSLKRYEDVHAESMKADQAQIDAVKALYQSVLEQLRYMHTADYEIKGEKLSFKSQEALDKYVALNKNIDAANTDLHKTTEAVRKSFDNMNKALKDLVAKVNAEQ